MAPTDQEIQHYFAMVHHKDDARKVEGYLWVINNVLAPEASAMSGNPLGPKMETAVFHGVTYQAVPLKMDFDPLQLPHIMKRTDRYSLYLVPELSQLIARHERRRTISWEDVDLSQFPFSSIGNVLGHMMLLDPPEHRIRQMDRFNAGYKEAGQRGWVASI